MKYGELGMKEKDEMKQLKSKDKFGNLKCDYFLRNLFNILQKKNSLNMVKFNKNMKKRINTNIYDYKEFSEKYSSIEIEIKPVINKYGTFINFKEEDEKYYHIYFNNDKEEIKRNHIIKGEHISIIKIIIDYQVKSFENLFLMCNCIESINFKKFYRNDIINMHNMFFECKSLKQLNLQNFKTNNVTDMGYMFYACSSLKELSLDNFNTNNVINMSNMFYGCSLLKELNLNNFNTTNVTNMSYMFYGCSSLKELKIINFDTSFVNNMNFMFYNCPLLNQLNLNNFIINNETSIFYMFHGCSKELILKVKSQYHNIKGEAF